MQRLADHPAGQDGLGGHRLLPHGVGVGRAVGPVLDHHGGQVVLGEAGVGQQPLGPEGEVGGGGGEPGLFLPGGEERGADDPLGHLLDAEHEDAVVAARGDGLGAELEGGAAAGAAGFDVDDGRAREGQGTQHPVAGGHAAVGGPAVGGLEAAGADPGLGHRCPHRRHAEIDQAPVLEPPERVQPHPGHLDPPHRSPHRSFWVQRCVVGNRALVPERVGRSFWVQRCVVGNRALVPERVEREVVRVMGPVPGRGQRPRWRCRGRPRR